MYHADSFNKRVQKMKNAKIAALRGTVSVLIALIAAFSVALVNNLYMALFLAFIAVCAAAIAITCYELMLECLEIAVRNQKIAEWKLK